MTDPMPTGDIPAEPAGDDEDDRWCMAVRLLGRIEQRLDQALQLSHGLQLSEYRALCALGREENEGSLRMGELAERIGLKDSSVTRLVGRLEARGMVERTSVGGRDGRGVRAVTTEAGRIRYARATATYRAALGAELDAARENVYLAELATWVRGARPADATSTRQPPPPTESSA